MSDIITVFRKEFSELFGEKHSRRGLMVQLTLITIALGVVSPYLGATNWKASSPSVVFLFFLMPGMLASTIAADAFAGERERKTLETLLTTPLSEKAIVFGKAMTSILYGTMAAVIALCFATVTVNVKLGAPFFFPSVEVLRGALGATLASATATTAIAINVSMHMPVARSAQQICALASMAIVGMVAGYFYVSHTPFEWNNIFTTEAAVFAVGALGIRLASVLFSRERFFDRD